MKVIKAIIERMKKALGLHVAVAFHADLARELAAEEAALQAEAVGYDRAGQHGAAAQLRRAAGKIGFDLKALDDVDDGLRRLLQPEPDSLDDEVEPEPVPELPMTVTPAAVSPVAAAPDPPARRGPGRPRRAQEFPAPSPSTGPGSGATP